MINTGASFDDGTNSGGLATIMQPAFGPTFAMTMTADTRDGKLTKFLEARSCKGIPGDEICDPSVESCTQVNECSGSLVLQPITNG